MPPESPTATSARPRVLVVDDAPDMRRSIARLLRGRVEITEAEDGQAAVDLILQAREAGAQFDVIIIDVEMPRLNGRDALEAIARIAPALADRAIVMSGGTWQAALGKWLSALPSHRILHKPMSLEALREAVRRALE